MKNQRQFIIAATLLALFSSPLLYAFEDCGTSVTECKLRQTIKALQERSVQLEKENKTLRQESTSEWILRQTIKALQERIVQLEKENKTLRQEPTSGFFQDRLKIFFFQDRLKDGSLGPKMVWIPAGTFRMGGGGRSYEKPVHRVSVSRFAMGMYEVTFAEYDKFAEATGREKPSDSGWGRGNRPVIYVSWHDATAYAKWLSQQTGKEYRLPSEAEWEYAARAGTTTEYWWGNTIGSNKANCNNSSCGDSFKYTAPVGSFAPNSFGLYDTANNVWEWCADSWHPNYKGAPSDGQVWRGGDENSRVLRGGSWYCESMNGRSAHRSMNDSDKRNGLFGFRVIRGADY